MSLESIVFSVIITFLIGSIPFSYIVTKIVANKDIREIGSGNPGATNVVRALNVPAGVVVLILDVLKGYLPMRWAMQQNVDFLIPAVALAVVLGHDYSLYLRFNGGKGVATSLGVFFVLNPVPTVLIVLIFFVLTTAFKFISFGSVLGAVSYPIIAYILGRTEYLWVAVILAALIVLKHSANIKRLWYGKEKRAV